MPSLVRIKFWGTRGSIARPGPSTLRYGGNTSCVEVMSARGTRVVIDCGTGGYELGRSLADDGGGPLHGHLLISHTHWDHIQGFPFFAPLFVRGGRWDIFGPTGLGKSLRDSLAGQMEHTYFPVSLEEMGANIHFHDLVEGQFEIDGIKIEARYLNHTALTLGYRLELDGVTVAYACDHEPYGWAGGGEREVHELDRRHSDFLSRADLLIHDAQFTDAEYPERVGWGHSPVGYVVEMARRAGVRRLALTHHDPGRTDDDLDAMANRVRRELEARQSELDVFAAADGQVETLVPVSGRESGPSRGRSALVVARGAMVGSPLLVIGSADETVGHVLQEAAEAAGVSAVWACDSDSVLSLAARHRPPLIVLEDAAEAGLDGLRLCAELRRAPEMELRTAIIALVGKHLRMREAESVRATQWLLTPFSSHYARAQIQAWLLRTSCRWVRAPRPMDEEARLSALRELSILDTRPEERFDRLTRLAAAIAEAPIVLVSLVDADRQWFKSCQGLSQTETPREVSFCAHVLATRTAMVVPDTLLDERFADNPLVVGATRVRFYAGFPVFHANGSCLGTLCLLDTRPRQLLPEVIERLEDLARVVEDELNASLRKAAAQ